MQEEKLKRLINDVGMAVFVKYYYVFKQRDRQKAISGISENFTPDSKGTRTSKAFKIFNENLNLKILELIMSSTRIDSAVSNRAKEIYAEENRS